MYSTSFFQVSFSLQMWKTAVLSNYLRSVKYYAEDNLPDALTAAEQTAINPDSRTFNEYKENT